MTEFETRLIRCLIDRFEAALRAEAPVPAAVAGTSKVPTAGSGGEAAAVQRLPGPEELDLYLVLRSTLIEHDPDLPEHQGRERGGVVSYNGHVYCAFDDWRVGIFRDVPAL